MRTAGVNYLSSTPEGSHDFVMVLGIRLLHPFELAIDTSASSNTVTIIMSRSTSHIRSTLEALKAVSLIDQPPGGGYRSTE